MSTLTATIRREVVLLTDDEGSLAAIPPVHVDESRHVSLEDEGGRSAVGHIEQIAFVLPPDGGRLIPYPRSHLLGRPDQR